LLRGGKRRQEEAGGGKRRQEEARGGKRRQKGPNCPFDAWWTDNSFMKIDSVLVSIYPSK
jgi:hypothetical protein